MNVVLHHNVFKELDPQFQSFVREVDIVNRLHSFEIVFPHKNNQRLGGVMMDKDSSLVKRVVLSDSLNNGTFSVSSYIQSDPELTYMCTHIPTSFLRHFRMGIGYYKKKNLKKAESSFKNALVFWPNDICTTNWISKIQEK